MTSKWLDLDAIKLRRDVQWKQLLQGDKDLHTRTVSIMLYEDIPALIREIEILDYELSWWKQNAILTKCRCPVEVNDE